MSTTSPRVLHPEVFSSRVFEESLTTTRLVDTSFLPSSRPTFYFESRVGCPSGVLSTPQDTSTGFNPIPLVRTCEVLLISKPVFDRDPFTVLRTHSIDRSRFSLRTSPNCRLETVSRRCRHHYVIIGNILYITLSYNILLIYNKLYITLTYNILLVHYI